MWVDWDILLVDIFSKVSVILRNKSWSLTDTIFLSQTMIFPQSPACFSNPSVVMNLLIIQSPIS